MVISAHAYPWDVVGDPAFVERVHASGVQRITLAAGYHSTRAATPNHPGHKLVDVPYAALYRPVRPGLWGRLEPKSFGDGDLFGQAFAILHDAGVKVNAWIVLAHNTRLGLLHPDVTVVNCFGERYPYALCPSRREVVDHCTTLAAEALRDVPVDGVSLESCGQMGLAHVGCHEKTDGAFTPSQQRLLSICCCAACGVSASLVRKWFETSTPPSEEVLEPRHAAADTLRASVLAAVRDTAPGASITLHAQADPWATGPSPGLTATAADDVDSILMPCWPLDSTVTPGAEAYVTTLPPFGADRNKLRAHVRELASAGASGLALYHLGLTPDPAPLFATLARTFLSTGGQP